MYNNAEEASGQHNRSYTLRHRWFGTVQDYSQRKLTYGKDKLIALSGLAHDYAEREQRGKYAAGLWEVDMPSALLWRTHQYPPDMSQAINADPCLPPQRPSAYRAPSWSWASVDGHIIYDSQMLESDGEHGGIWLPDDPPSPREPSEYDFGAFRIQGLETVTSPSDPMGAVSAGHITLTGLVATAIIDKETFTINRSGWDSTYVWLRDPEGLIVGALLADVQTEVQPYEDIWCVSVRDEQDGAEVKMPEELGKVNSGEVGDPFERDGMIMGLGLVKFGKEGAAEIFRRLGLVRWVRKELFVGKEVLTIKIV